MIILASCSTSSDFSKRKLSSGSFKLNKNHTSLSGNKSSEARFGEEVVQKEEVVLERRGGLKKSDKKIRFKEVKLQEQNEVFYFEAPKSYTEENFASQNVFPKAKRLQELPIPTDTIVKLSEMDREIALENEKKGKDSVIFGVIGLLLTFLIFPLGIVANIIGLIKGLRSLNSEINTESGLSNAKIGVAINVVALVLQFLVVLLITLIILALLL